MRKFTRISMLLALAVVFGIFESFFPILGGIIPGLKLGLANTVILTVLFLYSFQDAFYVSLLRVLLVGVLRTGLFNLPFYFSFVGALFSVCIMALAKRYTPLSMIGISILGSVFHSLGQLVVAFLFLHNTAVFAYLPWLILFAIPAGYVIGIVSLQITNYLKKILSF